MLDRPIQHLCPFEILSHADAVSEQENKEACEPTEHGTHPEQPAFQPRSATTQARNHWIERWRYFDASEH